jgi:hypothetical protein
MGFGTFVARPTRSGDRSAQVAEGLDPQRVDDVGPFPLQEMPGARDDERTDAIRERPLAERDEVRLDDVIVGALEDESGRVDGSVHEGGL